jgi:hypothetical protein
MEDYGSILPVRSRHEGHVTEGLKVQISKDKIKGIKLLAAQAFDSGQKILINPAKRIKKIKEPLDFKMAQYLFVDPTRYRPGCRRDFIIVCGVLTFLNHNDTPNCKVEWVQDEMCMDFLFCHLVADAAIARGDELTIRYTDAADYKDFGYF